MQQSYCKKCKKLRQQDVRTANHKYCTVCGTVYTTVNIYSLAKKFLTNAWKCIEDCRNIKNEIYNLAEIKREISRKIKIIDNVFDKTVNNFSESEYYEAKNKRLASRHLLDNKLRDSELKINKLKDKINTLISVQISCVNSFFIPFLEQEINKMKPGEDWLIDENNNPYTRSWLILHVFGIILDLMDFDTWKDANDDHYELIIRVTVNCLKQFTVIYHDDAKAYYYLAMAARRGKNNKLALSSTEMALKQHNICAGISKSKIHNLKGLILIDERKYEDAIKIFDLACKDEFLQHLDEEFLCYLDNKKIALDKIYVMDYAVKNGIDYDEAEMRIETEEENVRQIMREDIKKMYENALDYIRSDIKYIDTLQSGLESGEQYIRYYKLCEKHKAWLFHGMGSILLKLERKDEARVAFLEASKCNPDMIPV